MKDLFARLAHLDFDADLLCEWRNDPGTLRYSVVPQPVGKSEHAAWLVRVLRDPSRRLMMVYLRNYASEPIGTYRLDPVRTDVVEVSLTIAPAWRGRRLATPVIVMASEHAVRLGALVVRAVVHSKNAASRRAFASAGYVLNAGQNFASFETYDCGWRGVVGRLCEHCRRGVPHHTNSAESISGGDRHYVWDLHALDNSSGVRLEECAAGDILLARAEAFAKVHGGQAVRSAAVAGGATNVALPAQALGSTPRPSTTKYRMAVDLEMYMKNPMVFDHRLHIKCPIGRVTSVYQGVGYIDFNIEFDPGVALPERWKLEPSWVVQLDGSLRLTEITVV